MLNTLTRSILPALAMGTALSGCNVSWSGDVSGVPLADLDMGGDAPSEIMLAGPDEVIIVEGDTFAITLEGDADAGEAMRFDRDEDSLTIARDSEVFDGSGKAIVRITMPAPRELGIAGSGKITSAVIGAEGEIEIAGSGDIEVQEVAAQSLSIEIVGSGDVKAAGRSKKLEIEIAGAGNVGLQNLKADEVTVEIAGSGDVELASDGTVDVSIAGSGDVTVFGNAKCNFESAGSGTVSCKPAPKRAETAATAE